MPRNPNKTPCGIPGCRAWAIRGSHPPRCSPHRHTTLEAGANPDDNRATGTAGSASPSTTYGPARSPTVGAPPGNRNRQTHGFYSKILRKEEGSDLLAYATDTTLDAEIAVARVALRRILSMLLTGVMPGPGAQPLDLQDYARFAGLAFQGANTISRLLRARQTLDPETSALTRAIYQVLDELGEQQGVDL